MKAVVALLLLAVVAANAQIQVCQNTRVSLFAGDSSEAVAEAVALLHDSGGFQLYDSANVEVFTTSIV